LWLYSQPVQPQLDTCPTLRSSVRQGPVQGSSISIHAARIIRTRTTVGTATSAIEDVRPTGVPSRLRPGESAITMRDAVPKVKSMILYNEVRKCLRRKFDYCRNPADLGGRLDARNQAQGRLSAFNFGSWRDHPNTSLDKTRSQHVSLVRCLRYYSRFPASNRRGILNSSRRAAKL